MPNSWINHKGKKVLLVDYRGEDEAAMFRTVDESTEIIRKAPAKVLVLADVTDVVGSVAFIKHAAAQGAKVEQKVPKAAIIGVSVIKKALLIGYNRVMRQKGFKPFNTKEEALDWLVK